jgi:DNA-directed RNA polymerase specialized sigma24 family protein
MVYCVVPPEVAPRVRRLFDHALGDTPGVAVIHERRGAERRRAEDRRVAADDAPGGGERRQVLYASGRRVAERRATLVPVARPRLPRKAEHNADQVWFVEPLEVPPQLEQDIDAVRAIARFQAGERDMFAELYGRWFDPIYTYLRVVLGRPAEADQRVCTVFAQMLRELPRVAPTLGQIRAWIFGFAYQAAPFERSELARPTPANGAAHPVTPGDGALEESCLDGLTDDDLLVLVARRPRAERHLLMLRYLAGLRFDEIAEILGLHLRETVELHGSTLSAVEATLAAVTRSQRVGGQLPMSQAKDQTRVLYRRRRALLAA